MQKTRLLPRADYLENVYNRYKRELDFWKSQTLTPEHKAEITKNIKKYTTWIKEVQNLIKRTS